MMIFISPSIPPTTNRLNDRVRRFSGERNEREEGERQKSYTFHTPIFYYNKNGGIEILGSSE
jgi:hypothetical protein